MARFSAWISLLLALGLPALADAPPPGFRALWNGRDLDGLFVRDGEAAARPASGHPDGGKATAWRMEDGHLVGTGPAAALGPGDAMDDFELLIDFRVSPGSRGQVQLRGWPGVEIVDASAPDSPGSGGLTGQAPGSPARKAARKMDHAPGEWNQLRIRMLGESVTVSLNDHPVIEHARLEDHARPGTSVPASGPISLLVESGEIHWRGGFIREIPWPEANDALRAASGTDGWKLLFNGENLEGWQGALDSWEIRPDGVLACRTGAGGTLFTTSEFTDFVFQCEFLLPPGGNNGVAVRAPPGGDPAWEGMEIQILDDRAAKNANIKPTQAHGSIYGVFPARRGYLRPIHAWNFQEIRLAGDEITVTLNGTRILQTRLGTIDRTTLARIPKGLDRKSGHLGLAGHKDPVAFRQIRVKPLP